MTLLKMTDPERFRTTYYNARRYLDPLPADATWGPTGEDEKLPNCTSIAKAVGSDAFFKRVDNVRGPLDAWRVANYGVDSWDLLAQMPPDERRMALFQSAGRDLNRAGARGTAVHAMIESLLNGQTPMILDAGADEYRDVAEAVAAEFAGVIDLAEVVAFSRGHDSHTDYAGTFDGWHAEGNVLLDWKTRGPDSKHGAYEKEVAQLGLAQMCDYYIAPTDDGGAERRPVPDFAEMLVVSIRPDGFEVYPVDPTEAVATAERALEIFAAKKAGAASARRAIGNPRPNAVAGEPQASADADVGPVESTHTNAHPPPVPERTVWFHERYEALLAAGVERPAIAAVWPAGVPGPARSHEWTEADLDAAVAAVQRLEDDHGLPFADRDPANAHQPRHIVVEDAATVDGLRPYEGRTTETPLMDAESVLALKSKIIGSGAEIGATISAWLKQGDDAGRPWRMGAGVVEVRRWSIFRAVLLLAQHTDDDETARGWIALVIGEDACRSFPPGALLGTLTQTEADRLAELAGADTFAAAIEMAA